MRKRDMMGERDIERETLMRDDERDIDERETLMRERERDVDERHGSVAPRGP